MTTKTKARGATDELERREERWSEAKATSDELGREFRVKRERAQDLAELRRHRIHREPGLVDHLGQPLDPDGDIAQIDRDIASLGDLVDLHARYDHARKIEENAKQAVQAYKERHYEQLVEHQRPARRPSPPRFATRPTSCSKSSGSTWTFGTRPSR